MKRFKGIQEQITENKRKTILLLMMFPILILISVFGIIFSLELYNEHHAFADGDASKQGAFMFLCYLFFYSCYLIGHSSMENILYKIKDYLFQVDMQIVWHEFFHAVPWVLGGVAIWFAIAYFLHTPMVNLSMKSKVVERNENARLYNLVENVCMRVGMTVPKIRIIESSALNSFVSGIDKSSYTLTLTAGITEKLNDEELEAVIAHEIAHIRNKDAQVMVVSVIFVGIFAFIIGLFRRIFSFSLLFSGRESGNNSSSGKGMIGIIFLIVGIVFSSFAHFFSVFFKAMLSQKREYLADVSAIEITQNAKALSSALSKISKDDSVSEIRNEELKQMLISNMDEDKIRGFSLTQLFSNHPPMDERIQFIDQLDKV